MKLKNTNILILSLLAMIFPYVAAAETDCFDETQSLLSIILCLDQKGIDNAKAISKAVEESEITSLTYKLTTLAKKQNEEIVILKKKLVKLKIQLADKLVKEIAKQSGQLTTLVGKHNLEIKALTDKLRQVTYLAGNHDSDITALTYQLTTLAKKQNQEIVVLNNKLVKLKTQLADKLVKEIAKQSGQLTTLVGKHNLEIKALNDKLRKVTYVAQKQRQEIVFLKTQVLKNQNQSSKLEQQLVDLKQALEKLKGEVVHFEQPFKLDSFKVKAFHLR
jgi:hypothetical protein